MFTTSKTGTSPIRESCMLDFWLNVDKGSTLDESNEVGRIKGGRELMIGLSYKM